MAANSDKARLRIHRQLSDRAFGTGMHVACAQRVYGTPRDFVKRTRQKSLFR